MCSYVYMYFKGAYFLIMTLKMGKQNFLSGLLSLEWLFVFAYQVGFTLMATLREKFVKVKSNVFLIPVVILIN